MSQPADLVFGPFRLDRSGERLYRGAEVIPLRPKSHAVLTYLTEHAGELVTKERLLESLWSGTYVSDAVLKVCIREVRHALGDSSTAPSFIETAHRRGYRFIGSVQAIETAAVPPYTGTLVGSPSDGLTGGVVGRQAELAWLLALADRSRAGRRQLALISGEPGIGKTALAGAFAAHARLACGAVVARGQCIEHHGPAEPYLPWLEALSRLADSAARDRVCDVLLRFAPSWLGQLPALAGAADGETLRAVLASTTPPRMLREMGDALEALSRETLLVIMLDDLQWSDPSSLDLLAYVARRPDTARLMLVGLYRPAEAADPRQPFRAVLQELHARHHCEERRLALLTEADVAAYVAAIADESDAAAIADLIYRWTDGNPLFMVSLLHELRARDLVSEAGGRLTFRRSAAVHQRLLPESLRHLIDRQFERLQPNEQQLLEAAAVVGHEWESSVVGRALGIDPMAIEYCADALSAQQIFVRATPGTAGDSRRSLYTFQHALYRDALYQRLLAARRRGLHTSVAQALERGPSTVPYAVSEIARHFEQSDRPDRAVGYYGTAAEQSMRCYATREAETQLERGTALLAAVRDGDERERQELRLRLLQGVLLAATRGHAADETHRCYERARQLADAIGDEGQRFRARVGLWASALVGARLEPAHTLAGELITLADGGPHPVERLQARWTALVTAVNRSELAEAVSHFDVAMALASECDPIAQIELFGHDARVTCRGFAAWAFWMLGSLRRSQDLSVEAVKIAEETKHPHTLAFAYFFAAFVHALRRDAQPALEWAERTVAVGDEHCLAQWRAFGRILRGWARGVINPKSTGAEELEDALESYRGTGAEISRPHFLGLLGEVLAGRGDRPAARACVDEAIATARRTGEVYYLPELLRLRVSVAGAGHANRTGPSGHDSTAAARCLEEAIAAARIQGARTFELRAAIDLARLVEVCQLRGSGRPRDRVVACLRRMPELEDSPDTRAAADLLGRVVARTASDSSPSRRPRRQTRGRH